MVSLRRTPQQPFHTIVIVDERMMNEDEGSMKRSGAHSGGRRHHSVGFRSTRARNRSQRASF
jgi:hypothetical protein